jgi:hypothetical protein
MDVFSVSPTAVAGRGHGADHHARHSVAVVIFLMRPLEQKWRLGHQTGKLSADKGVLYVESHFQRTVRRTSQGVDEAAH